MDAPDGLAYSPAPMPFSFAAQSRLASLLVAASLLLGITLATSKTASALELGYGQNGVGASGSARPNRTGLRRQPSENNRLEIPVSRAKPASAFNYAKNGPVNHVDPTGRWGEKVHHEAFRDRFEGVLSQGSIEAMKAGSDHIDRLAAQLEPGSSPIHAMRDPGQSQETAETARETFMADQAGSAKRYFDAAKGLARWGTQGSIERSQEMMKKAYFHVGQLLHSAQDLTSPVHVVNGEYQEWGGMLNADALKHGDSRWSQESLDAFTPEMRTQTLESMNNAINEYFSDYQEYFPGGQ